MSDSLSVQTPEQGRKTRTVRRVLFDISSCGTVLFVGAVLIWTLGHWVIQPMTPELRNFYLADATLWNPLSEEDSVPIAQVWIVYAAAYVPTIFLLESLVRRRDWSTGEVFKSFLRFSLGIFGAVLISDMLVDAAKLAAGSLRPDFYRRCYGLDADLPSTDELTTVIESNADCPMDDVDLLNYGRRSFPSGHAANGMCGGLFMTLYLVNVTYRLRRPWFSQILLFVSLVPLVYGFHVAISRVMDYRHHPADIVGGGMIGVIIASIYFLWTLILGKNSGQDTA